MKKNIPKETVDIIAELKRVCYEGESYCNSFSPSEKSFVEHFWNNPETYYCIAFDKNGNELDDNQLDYVS